MENLGRHSKKIVSLMLITVMVLTIGVCSFSFDSNAATYNYYVIQMDRPQVSDYAGYVELLIERNSDGYKMAITLFWSIYGSVYDYAPSLSVSVSTGSANFKPTGAEYVDLKYMSSDGRDVPVTLANGSVDPYAGVSYTPSGFTIKSYHVYGAGNVDSSLPNWTESTFVCVYGDEYQDYQMLEKIYDELLESNANDEEMIAKLDSIMNSNASIDSKLSQLLALQEENNTWLQKIWTSIQRFFKGDNATDDTKVEEFSSTSKEQSDSLNELNEQNKTDKIDVDSTSNEIDSNIDTEAIGNYGTVLSVFTSNTHILQYILIVLAVALIAYVLFGKR